jgi:hypothetical protein
VLLTPGKLVMKELSRKLDKINYLMIIATYIMLVILCLPYELFMVLFHVMIAITAAVY